VNLTIYSNVGNLVTCLEHDRPIKKEKAMLTARKIMLSARDSAAFANAPGGAYIQ
jgi:hypothetical protein